MKNGYNNSCIQIKIKAHGTAIKSMKAIIDTGNNLPHPAISLGAYKMLIHEKIANPGIDKTSTKAISAGKKEIQVLGIAEGNFTLYLGKSNATNIKKFIVISQQK